MKSDNPTSNPSHPGMPRWEEKGATYFINFSLREESGELCHAERSLIFNLILDGDNKLYLLFSAVVMPDHVHIILKPHVSDESLQLSQILQKIKGSSSFYINKLRGSSGPLWKPRSYTRIVRNEAELYEEMKYIANNPVIPGYAKTPEECQFYWRKGMKRNPGIDAASIKSPEPG